MDAETPTKGRCHWRTLKSRRLHNSSPAGPQARISCQFPGRNSGERGSKGEERGFFTLMLPLGKGAGGRTQNRVAKLKGRGWEDPWTSPYLSVSHLAPRQQQRECRGASRRPRPPQAPWPAPPLRLRQDGPPRPGRDGPTRVQPQPAGLTLARRPAMPTRRPPPPHAWNCASPAPAEPRPCVLTPDAAAASPTGERGDDEKLPRGPPSHREQAPECLLRPRPAPTVASAWRWRPGGQFLRQPGASSPARPSPPGRWKEHEEEKGTVSRLSFKWS